MIAGCWSFGCWSFGPFSDKLDNLDWKFDRDASDYKQYSSFLW
jgi:hypothetical protein